MKKFKIIVIYASFLSLILTACSERNELYIITDGFVKSLSTTIESYGVFKSGTEKKITTDNRYQVMPTGRLIIVKFIDYVDNKEYKKLKDDLADHYSGDKRVNDVYINQGGTVVIDCRR
jgi:hypothetical protein